MNERHFCPGQPPHICSSGVKHPSVGLMVGCCRQTCCGLTAWPPRPRYSSRVNFSENGSPAPACAAIHAHIPRARVHVHPATSQKERVAKGFLLANFCFTRDWAFSEAPALSPCLHCKKCKRGHLNEMNSDNQEEEIDYYYQMALQRDYRPRLPITAQPQLPRPKTGWFPSMKCNNRLDVRCKDKRVVFKGNGSFQHPVKSVERQT